MPGVLNNPSPKPQSSFRTLRCGGRELDLSYCRVMGVLNITPDSFSDGGQFHRGDRLDLDRALARAEQLVEDGAAILDVGGESTRPGAGAVSLQQELDRVVPVVEAIATRLDVIISVDTSSPEVMSAAATAGAALINDVRALQREGAVEMAASLGLPVCLMHMQGAPANMQDHPSYGDVVEEVLSFLKKRINTAIDAGIAQSAILLDPGFGFGKTLDHNLRLLNRLDRLVQTEYPVLVGLSRKSMIGSMLGRDVEQRMPASVGLAVIAAERGANIVRCHDVRETVDALSMLRYVKQEYFDG